MHTLILWFFKRLRIKRPSHIISTCKFSSSQKASGGPNSEDLKLMFWSLTILLPKLIRPRNFYGKLSTWVRNKIQLMYEIPEPGSKKSTNKLLPHK